MKYCNTCQKPFQSDQWKCTHCNTTPLIQNGIPVFAPSFVKESDGYRSEVFDDMPYSDRAPHYFNKARSLLFIWSLKYFFPDVTSFFEIGCGKGTILSAMKKAYPLLSLWGSEIYLKGLEQIKQNLKSVNLLQTDARQLPFQEEFGVIGAFDVLEHIEEDECVLREMYRAVKPQGGIIISVPQHPQLWSQRDEALCHKRRYTKAELVKRVGNAGFNVCRVTSFNTLLFPVFLICVMKNRQPQKNYDPFRELNIAQPFQTVLSGIFSLERKLIELGVSFPFGGSILLIAKRS